MSNPNQNIPEQPSTPQQAADIFTQMGELTAFQGTLRGDSHLYSDPAVVVPASVAIHFPVPEVDSASVETSMDVSQKFDRQTGKPVTGGTVGTVTFTQREHRDAALTYVTDVNYQIVSSSGVYGLERHVTSNELGPRKTLGLPGGMIASHEEMRDFMDELTTLQAKVHEARAIEADLGLLTVTSLEADQIRQLLTDLNNPK